MRIVVDTNVFVSAAFKKSSVPEMVVRWIDIMAACLSRRLQNRNYCKSCKDHGLPLYCLRHFYTTYLCFLPKQSGSRSRSPFDAAAIPKMTNFLNSPSIVMPIFLLQAIKTCSHWAHLKIFRYLSQAIFFTLLRDRVQTCKVE